MDNADEAPLSRVNEAFFVFATIGRPRLGNFFEFFLGDFCEDGIRIFTINTRRSFYKWVTFYHNRSVTIGQG